MKHQLFKIGDWTVDTASSRIERHGAECHLEPRLTDLLLHFARNPQKVIPKDELIDVVWDGRVLDNTAVARAVAELRKVLGDTAKSPRYIETIPKRGYRLVARVTRPRRRQTITLASAIILVALLVVAATRTREPVGVITPRTTTPGTTDTQALRAYRLAAEALRSGGQTNNENAIVHLSVALERDPNFALAHAALAEAYSVRATWYGADGDWGNASLAEASQAVALAPNRTESHRALGTALSTQGRFEDAESSYRRALDLSPHDKDTRFRLGEILSYRGEWPRALATFETLADDDTVSTRLQCEIGALLHGLDYLTESHVWFDAAVATEPFETTANILLALYDIAAGELESARSRILQLSDAIAGCEVCDQVLGEIAFRQQRREDAMFHFGRALERTVAPKSILIHIRLAQLDDDSDALRTISASLERQASSGNDIWFSAWLLAVVHAELGEASTAMAWHAEARARGYLDWRTDLTEPAFASLRPTPGFQSAILAMQERIEQMRQEVESTGLLDVIRERTNQLSRSAEP